MVICLGRGADLHMAQLMPLPLTVSCSNKIQIGFTFLVPAYPGSPGQRAVKRVCMYVLLTYLRAGSSVPVGVREALYWRQHDDEPRMFVVRKRCQGRGRWHLDNAAETIVAGGGARPAAEVVPLAADGGGGTALRRRHAVVRDPT